MLSQRIQVLVCICHLYLLTYKRKFLKLKQFKTFAEINPEPSIAAALQELYKTVDDVELYAGAVAEEVTIHYSERKI